jgi:hypothetical protein
VVPESQIENAESNWGGITVFLREHYEQVQAVPFPADARPYNEVIVFGVKRKAAVDKYQVTWESCLARPGTKYRIPIGWPVTFKKVNPTDEELSAALAASPLRLRWQAPVPYQVPSPPMALGIGHCALLLASGHLDGIVESNGSTHVVRGTSRKKEYVASVTTTVDSKGKESTVTIKRERIDLIVRTVDLSGALKTYMQEPEEEAVDETA